MKQNRPYHKALTKSPWSRPSLLHFRRTPQRSLSAWTWLVLRRRQMSRFQSHVWLRRVYKQENMDQNAEVNWRREAQEILASYELVRGHQLQVTLCLGNKCANNALVI